MSSSTSGEVLDWLYMKGYLTPNQAENPTPSNRDELLQTMITSLVVNIEPLGGDFFLTVRKLTKGIFRFLPAIISPAGFSHASIYVPVPDNENEGVWIEYGAYDNNREGDFKGEVHYLDDDNGLRFAKVTKAEYVERALRAGEFFKFVECQVRNQMTIGELLQRVSENNTWSKNTYFAVAQNCQRFVDYAIRVLGAYRNELSFRIDDKESIPYGLIDALDDNKIDSECENIRRIEKTPIYGPLFDLIIKYQVEKEKIKELKLELDKCNE